METVNKTASEILLEAADLLEQEGKWIQSWYFKPDASGGCKMCAHGAISFCGNSKVRELVKSKTSSTRKLGFLPYGNAEHIVAQEVNDVTFNPPNFSDEVALAHYKANKVGLTTSYNDNPTTTKQDVINKLREAAVL